jgi:hypothetical protein
MSKPASERWKPEGGLVLLLLSFSILGWRLDAGNAMLGFASTRFAFVNFVVCVLWLGVGVMLLSNIGDGSLSNQLTRPLESVKKLKKMFF